MKSKIYSFLFLLILTPYVLAETYIATQHEMKMADSSYIKSLHHIKIGKTVVISEFRAFGELGFGEDLNNGTALGSGSSYEYLRAGFSKKIFNNMQHPAWVFEGRNILDIKQLEQIGFQSFFIGKS